MKMMLKYFISLMLTVQCYMGWTQVNLVSNPSFELYYLKPEFGCDTNYDALFSSNPNTGDPNYLTELRQCSLGNTVPSNQFGYQYPNDGIAYYGIGVYWGGDTATLGYYLFREYISVQLTSPLIKERMYGVKFYVSLADSCAYAISDMSALLTDTLIHYNHYGTIPLTPQINNPRGRFLSDQNGWMEVSGSFIAHGDEQYITIGNFKDDPSTDTLRVFGPDKYVPYMWWKYQSSGYYIDMVSVIPCDSVFVAAEAGSNAVICRGDIITLGSQDKPYYSYSWEPTTGLSNPGVAQPQASPAQTTTYYLTTKYFDLSETKDSVTVYVKDCQAEPGFRIYPNPSVGDVTVELINGTFQDARIELINVLGQQIFSADIGNGIFKKQISFSKQPQGLYFCKVWNNGTLIGEEKIVIVNSE